MKKNDNPLSKRVSHLELPTGQEIMHISNAEEKRTLLPERMAVHFTDFSTIIQIYEHFGIDKKIFTNQDLTPKYILDMGGEQVEDLAKIILTRKLSNEEVVLLTDAYNYLSEEDEPEPSDYIYVFGAKTPFRPKKAAELYKKKLAPKVIFSGRGPFYGRTEDVSEAEKYAAIALEEGIPGTALIIEDSSITIPDNVRRTLNMMDAQKMKYHSFITITSPYSQRRGWCTWKKHTSENVKIYRVNCKTGPRFTANNWYKNEDGLKVVLGEFVKLRNTVAFNDA